MFKKFLPGSFNQLSVRYGTGIANGGDNGNSFTWTTFGAPDARGKYAGAYSLAIVEHFLVNLSKKISINGYGVYTHSKGGSSSHHMAKSFNGSMIYNQKTDFVVGARSLYYCTHWLHLISELHFAQRINGTEPAAQMWKFSFAPTIVPLGKNNPWCRPHIRLIYTLARYNDNALKSQLSPFLELNDKQWGSYLGIKTEWWLF
jgi:maltoporin